MRDSNCCYNVNVKMCENAIIEINSETIYKLEKVI